jgi:hypothetical protein
MLRDVCDDTENALIGESLNAQSVTDIRQVLVCINITIQAPKIICGNICHVIGKGKGEVHPRTGHEVPAVLFLFNLGARWGWVVSATPQPLYSRERLGTHSMGGWVGSRASLDRCRKYRPHWDLIPGSSGS